MTEASKGLNPNPLHCLRAAARGDLTPPSGKSMRWLQAEVARSYPNAQLLSEGDHLHAVFPGYYDAPVLGNPQSAGLRNPMQGGPCLPPGFTVQ